MITCKLQGGLGNQMFQIAAITSLAWKNNDIAKFDLNSHYLPSQGRKAHNYIDNIFRNVEFNDNIEIDSVYNEGGHQYVDMPYVKNSRFIGYFQSEKYFEDHVLKIKDLFSIDENTKNYIFEKYNDILKKKPTSIHIRRGDYLKFKDVHPVCKKEYYIEAMKRLPSDTEYLIFSDDPDWCLKSFAMKKFTVIRGEADFVDLFLMSLCQNNIIANSSFSWWAAWLNINEGKKIFAPKAWFGAAGPQYTDDIIPNSWIRL